jgi:hypothetical protein
VSSCQPKKFASNWARKRFNRQVLDRADLAITAIVEQRVAASASVAAMACRRRMLDAFRLA